MCYISLSLFHWNPQNSPATTSRNKTRLEENKLTLTMAIGEINRLLKKLLE